MRNTSQCISSSWNITHINFAFTRAHSNAPLRNHRSKFGPQINNLSSIIRGFKGAVKYSIKKNLKRHDFAWQRSFYDHIIRDIESLMHIREYIRANPIRWENRIMK